MNIGICGSHRTGKTTLAQAIATQLNIPFAVTSTSDVFFQHGLDPAQPLEFEQRLWIQQKVLLAGEQIWQQYVSTGFITDRTPIDMMAYTLADIQGDTTVDFAALQIYLTDCFQITNQYFSQLFIIQPAIPLVHETGKAALNKAYIEHLNSLIIGLCYDEQIQIKPLVIKRETINLAERIKLILQTIRDSRSGCP